MRSSFSFSGFVAARFSNHSRIIAVISFGLLFLPLLFAEAQPAKEKRAVDLLTDAINKVDEKKYTLEERRRAVDELLEASQNIRLLVNVLSRAVEKDPEGEIRVKAAKLLAIYGRMAPHAASFLIRALERDKFPDVRIEAANALGMIMWEGSNPSYAKSIVPALVRAMRHDEDTLVRRTACAAFRVMGPVAKDGALDLLELIKTTDDEYLRALARTSFLTIVGPDNSRLTPDLLEMHSKGIETPELEALVLLALGKIGAKEELILPLLMDTLKHHNPKHLRSREAAALALGELGSKAKPAVPLLIKAMEESIMLKHDDPRNIALAVLRAISQIGPEAKAASPALQKIASDPRVDRQIQYGAKRALEAIQKAPRK